MYNRELLYQLETKFLETRNKDDLVPLYKELLNASRTLCAFYIRRIGLLLPYDRLESTIYESTIRLLEMYLKHPNQGRIPHIPRLKLEIKFQLHGKPRRKYEKLYDKELPLNLHITKEVIERDKNNYIDIISRLPYGKEMLIDLYRFSYYKRSILAISKYIPKEVIYKYAVELRTIFLILHGGKA